MTAAIRAFCVALFLLTFRAGAEAPVNADEVLQRYVDAVGGSEKLKAIRSRTMEARISMGWLSAKLKSRIVYPNRYVEEASIFGQDVESGYDGTTGWTRKGSKLRVVTDKALQRLLRGHSLDWDQQMPQWYPVRRLLPDEQLDGTTLHVVELTADTGEREIWRFDAATGLLRQFVGNKFDEDDPDKPPVPVTTTIDEYREVDGIRLAHKLTSVEGSTKVTMTVESVKHNQPQAPIQFPGKP